MVISRKKKGLHFVYSYLLTVFRKLGFWLWPEEIQKNLYTARGSKCLETPGLKGAKVVDSGVRLKVLFGRRRRRRR